MSEDINAISTIVTRIDTQNENKTIQLQPSWILMLPTEIHLQILSYLTVIHQNSVSNTCQYFKNLLASNALLKTRYSLHHSTELKYNIHDFLTDAITMIKSRATNQTATSFTIGLKTWGLLRDVIRPKSLNTEIISMPQIGLESECAFLNEQASLVGPDGLPIGQEELLKNAEFYQPIDRGTFAEVYVNSVWRPTDAIRRFYWQQLLYGINFQGMTVREAFELCAHFIIQRDRNLAHLMSDPGEERKYYFEFYGLRE
ncbi:hypothetical protein H072_343 [Dactylellina haptotyla CBS 200.50]|uniref:F-box domain-containing protein n=1 Tax=Dactylellina haptotyla (strain CBS 200.50) TaxID=1284197 RepID=S8ARY7_DACHA|nr:hypothetical protein H072_343 [Dactylellina haptotyla CBS 200.50]